MGYYCTLCAAVGDASRELILLLFFSSSISVFLPGARHRISSRRTKITGYPPDTPHPINAFTAAGVEPTVIDVRARTVRDDSVGRFIILRRRRTTRPPRTMYNPI